MVYPVEDGVNGLVPSLDRICKEVCIIEESMIPRLVALPVSNYVLSFPVLMNAL